MADLDDFFAKKDRKKSKAKKFTTTEEIARKMEETGRKSDKPKDKISILSSNFGPEGVDLSGNNEEDEEWKEFEEEEGKKDYTGLKIQNLTLQDLDDGHDNDGDNDGDQDDNVSQDAKNRTQGPWKVVENVDNQPPPAPVEKKVEKEKTPPPARKSYVPPQLRNQARGRTFERVTTRPGKPEAPDITNQEFFPTLSAAVSETSSSWNRKKQDAGFEEVRNSRSHSSRNESTRTPQGLRIGNKYGALESENS